MKDFANHLFEFFGDYTVLIAENNYLFIYLSALFSTNIAAFINVFLQLNFYLENLDMIIKEYSSDVVFIKTFKTLKSSSLVFILTISIPLTLLFFSNRFYLITLIIIICILHVRYRDFRKISKFINANDSFTNSEINEEELIKTDDILIKQANNLLKKEYIEQKVHTNPILQLLDNKSKRKENLGDLKESSGESYSESEKSEGNRISNANKRIETNFKLGKLNLEKFSSNTNQYTNSLNHMEIEKLLNKKTSKFEYAIVHDNQNENHHSYILNNKLKFNKSIKNLYNAKEEYKNYLKNDILREFFNNEYLSKEKLKITNSKDYSFNLNLSFFMICGLDIMFIIGVCMPSCIIANTISNFNVFKIVRINYFL